MKRVLGPGLGILTLAMVAFAGKPVAQQKPAADECTLPAKGAFSIGWVAEEGGKFYRCLPTFDASLKPAGAAWIEVVKDNRFIIKD